MMGDLDIQNGRTYVYTLFIDQPPDTICDGKKSL